MSHPSHYSQQVGDCMCGVHRESGTEWPECLTPTVRDSVALLRSYIGLSFNFSHVLYIKICGKLMKIVEIGKKSLND